jgi:hypothetical protein
VRDTLAGHFIAGAAGGFSWPYGRMDGRRLASDLLGSGYALNLDLGYGISRYVAVGAWAELDSYGHTGVCPRCDGKSFAAGPFIRYHLAQGTRFDPWGSFALGFRSTSESTLHADYSGFEWTRLMLGGDFYPFANFGFGPYLGMNLGTYTSHASLDGKANNKAYVNLATGLRIVIDFPGK